MINNWQRMCRAFGNGNRSNPSRLISELLIRDQEVLDLIHGCAQGREW